MEFKVRECPEESILEEIQEAIERFLAPRKKENLEQLLEKSKERIEQFKDKIPEDPEAVFFHENTETREEIRVAYSKVVESDHDGRSYDIEVTYQRTVTEEKTVIKVKDNKQDAVYTVAIAEDKNEPEKNYRVQIRYEDPQRTVDLAYNVPLWSYLEEREDKLQDFTHRVDKSLTLLPKSLMGGVLGFTYLGENFMARRDDLIGDTARMVDIHEAIHTPDEYETRILTEWMLKREMPKYKR